MQTPPWPRQRERLGQGDWIDPAQSRRAFDEVALDWLEHDPGKRVSTLRTERSILRSLPEDFKRRQMGSLRPSHLQDLVKALSSRQGPRTVRRTIGTVRAVLSWSVEREILPRSPYRGIRLPALTPARVRVLSPEDVRAIARVMPEQYRPMVSVAAQLGLRWSEVAALQVRHLDLLRRTLTVDQALTRDYAGRSVLGPPKSAAASRTLSMPEALAELLAAHLRRRGLSGADQGAFLFESPVGDPLNYTNWRGRVWAPAVQAAGLVNGACFHDLRRANATAMVQAGVDVKTAQVRLGHSDPRLTFGLYAQATSDADRLAAEHLGKVFAEPPAESGNAHGMPTG